jgi:hypothetical protein
VPSNCERCETINTITLKVDVCGIIFEQRWSRFNEALEILHILWNNGTEKGQGEDQDNDNIKSIAPAPYIDYASIGFIIIIPF